MYIAKPTKKQLEWQDLELGVLIHYLMETYEPYFNIESDNMEERVPAAMLNPPKLDPEQWVRSAWEMGAKYAILVAKHGSGFALWNTKENQYGCGEMAWKGGQGDILREFLDACKKYGLKPGIYYHPTCNKYYKIDNRLTYDYKGEMYQEYVSHVVGQLTELWSQYGEMFEIWFDGGCLPVEEGGPDLAALLKKYQPNAIAFQGPKDHPHNLRWVGNEDGLAPENCWATTNAGEARYDGSIPDEKAGVGDPDGKYYWPAETDMPNRTHAAENGGWGWKEGQEHLIYTPEQLLDCYIRSVGRNSNLLLGMAISADGDFRDEEQFKAFGQLIRDTFGNPAAVTENGCIVTLPEKQSVKYVVIREDITEGQRIRGFRILADGISVYESECIGHKRIVPFDALEAREITLEITKQAGNARVRDIAVY